MDILLVLHIFIVACLIIVILMQRSASDGFTGSSSGSSDAFLTAASKGNILTKTTAFLAIGFIVSSMVLTFIAARDTGTSLNFDEDQINIDLKVNEDAPAAPTAPAIPTQ